MACVGSTGQGLVLELSEDGIIANIRSLQLPEWMGESVDFTGIDKVDFRCKKPGNIAEPGEIVAEVFLDGTKLGPEGVTMWLMQTATITFPITNNGNTTEATLSGSGFIRAFGFGSASVNEPMVATITFAYDGETGPLVTPEAIGTP